MGVLIFLLVFAALALSLLRMRQIDKAKLLASFEAHEFDTSAGRLRGRDLRVVRYLFQQYKVMRLLRSGWWYCVAPGPSWLLVIGQDDFMTASPSTLKWVVQELSEERMRSALAGDAAAIRAAFESEGEAHRA